MTSEGDIRFLLRPSARSLEVNVRCQSSEAIDETREMRETQVKDLQALIKVSGQLARLTADFRAIERAMGTLADEKSGSGQCGCGTAGGKTGHESTPAVDALTEVRLHDRLQRAQRASAKAAAAARRLASWLVKDDPQATENRGERVLSSSLTVWRLARGQQRKLVELLARSGVDHDEAEAAVEASVKPEIGTTRQELLAAVKRLVVASDSLARSTFGSQDDSPTQESAGDARPATSRSISALTVEAGAAVVSAAVAFFGWLSDVLPDLFNASDDDRARDLISDSGCEALRAMTARQHFDLVDAMVRGPTGDDDELAILRLLDCLTCEQARALVNRFGTRGAGLISEFQGVEFDRLMIRLRECNVVRFNQWDDDTTRRFIAQSDCGSLRQLSPADRRQLLLNLFRGYTGDEDEAAIVKLVRCLTCEQRRALVRMPGMSVSDFDDEVDGAEWQQLRRLFQQCGIAA